MTINPQTLPEDFLRRMLPQDRMAIGKAARTREEIDFDYDVLSERELQSQIANYLRVKDIAFACQRMDRKSNIAMGWPDYIFAYFGKPIALECKVGTNQQTDEQYQMQNKMELNGWKYFVITALDQVRAILTAIEVGRA